MAITYFGYCNSSGVGTGAENLTLGKLVYQVAGYACPGSGDQDVKEIGIESNDSPGGNFRLGLYDSVGDLVVESTDHKASAYPSAWVVWDNTEITWRKGTKLTGGATYRIALGAAADYRYVGTTQAGNVSLYSGTNYSEGMPATISGAANYTFEFNMRVGVEPAAAAPTNIMLNII